MSLGAEGAGVERTEGLWEEGVDVMDHFPP